MFKKISFYAALCAVLTGCISSPAPLRKGKVYVGKEGKQYVLYRDGQPFRIKGAAGTENFAALHAAGGNTIRTWDTLGLGQLLDDAYANHIAVIAGFPMPVSSFSPFYNDTAKVAAQYTAFRNVVTRYKSHPALLMWCLGNEIDFPYKPRYNSFYKAYNHLLEMIHTEDPDHPVTTALINFNKRCLYNIRFKVTGLDLISMNIFGDLQHLQRNLEKFSWFWDGPFLISEWGINGPWEWELTTWGSPVENTSTRKAQRYLQMYEQYMPVNDPRFLGACVFYWGNKQEVTHTWFSLFTKDGQASETVNVMQYLWTGKWPANRAPALNMLLLNGKTGSNNILLNPNSLQTAEVLLAGTSAGSLQITWELLAEDWHTKNRDEPNTQKPVAYNNLLLKATGNKITFRSPGKEGPYRIFATVSDNKGHFATANTPFYVVSQ
ncbi:glycoside hydrolase family 2 TIM barrel-domain containing protein [Chitinophaga sp. OAE865]|uniref:glycoside hydrolase family 2 TIM barrel-domain containing protein n=1 Tax=Chitinophaga sp. OAE865 TaxID=2817898 RepID=UPI001AE79106